MTSFRDMGLLGQMTQPTRKMKMQFSVLHSLCLLLFFLISPGLFGTGLTTKILNASYDPTREFYTDFNPIFSKYWQKKTGQQVDIGQSYGGSGAQARAVISGLDADVVTLALAYDINMIAAKSKLLPENWQKKLPHNSCPYTSIIVFLVKQNNPKQIKDWDDLVRKEVKVIMPNPKTSGGARWAYLAALGYAQKKFGNQEVKVQEFLSQLYGNVPILNTGARGATTTFAINDIGDVLVTWENEAFLAAKSLGKGKFQMVYPSISILAEPPVAVIESNTNRKGTTPVAKAYLEYLYSKEAQELIAAHGYRPYDVNVAKKYADTFKKIPLLTINDFGGWDKAQKKYFDDGGLFDQIYRK